MEDSFFELDLGYGWRGMVGGVWLEGWGLVGGAATL